MTTKFSIRPAPRKRPWICKRSPPCLIPLPVPASLLVTFWVKNQPPPFPVEQLQGSFRVANIPGTQNYYGSWGTLTRYFDLHFTYTLDPPEASGGSAWITPSYAPLANWPLLTFVPPPGLNYYARYVSAMPNPWFGTLLVTG